jgi:hypothetical protein
VLIGQWKTFMNTAWVSSSNSASIYLANHPDCDKMLPPTWNFKASTLDGEEVWHAICLLSLIDDCALQNAMLNLPHGGPEARRLVEAIRARNTRIRLFGLPDVNHTCSKCIRRKPNGGATSELVRA